MNEDTDINFDKLIVGQIEIKEKWQKSLAEIEKRIALGTATAQDKVAAAEAKGNIKLAEAAITDLNKQRSEIKTLEKSEEQAATLSEERELIKKLVDDYHIGFIIPENKFMYCRDVSDPNKDIVNPLFQIIDAHKFGRMLNKMAKKRLRYGQKVLVDELIDLFQDTKNDYSLTTCSFNRAKWDKSQVYNKGDVIMKFWVEPNFDEAHDPRFDFLIKCVGGGKQENMDHLEKWLAFKYLNPDKVANTPNLDIGGYPGGNGKGRFVELCKTIFTNPCVSAAALKELMDGFNASWEMATLLYYDEPAKDELPDGKIKNATGSEDIRIERKGIDATMADRNYSIVFLSNNPNGVVKLAGTGSSGEDRRYSVIVTNLVMVDEAIKQGMDLKEAKDYVNSVNDIIKDRKEVAKFLGHIILKHNVADLSILQPLHGTDYYARFNDQKSSLDVAFDYMLPAFKQNELIPYEILKACIVAITGYEKLTDKTLKQDWKRYLEKNKITAEYYEGQQRLYIEYHYNNKDVLTVQKTAFIIKDSQSRKFNFAGILKRAPTNMKLAKDSCEQKDMLLLDENV